MGGITENSPPDCFLCGEGFGYFALVFADLIIRILAADEKNQPSRMGRLIFWQRVKVRREVWVESRKTVHRTVFFAEKDSALLRWFPPI